MFLMFQNELISSSSLKAVEVNTNVRRFRTASNRRYFKTRAESLK